jgi:para-aminobenzoate synthetase
MVNTLLVDNYDSYTFNLAHQIARVAGSEPFVVKNDEITIQQIAALAPDVVVLSPGPGHPRVPRDFGICSELVATGRYPTLGICLGHQGIGHYYGGRVTHAPRVMHGLLSAIYHSGTQLFAGLPQGFEVVRYHSLAVEPALPDVLEKAAWTDDGVVMGLHHRTLPLWGVQFHPESICTTYGDAIVANFFELALGRRPVVRPRPRPPTRPGVTNGRAARALSSRKLDFFVEPEDVFVELFAESETAIWLDSSMSRSELPDASSNRLGNGLRPAASRFTYIGDASGPSAYTIRYDMQGRQVSLARRNETIHQRQTIFDCLREHLAQPVVDDVDLPFDFHGGLCGYLGYELKADCGASDAHASATPEAMLVHLDRFLAFDHVERAIYLVARDVSGQQARVTAWFDEIERRLRTTPVAPPPRTDAARIPPTFALARGRDQYLAEIAACKRDITNGESYEICLTNKVRAAPIARPLDLYRILRRQSPAPFAAYLRFGSLAILSASPEQFLRVDRTGLITAKPIKGTRRRGANPDEDQQIREELRTSVKDRAENLMIVDLMRNDLGRVSVADTVEVPVLMDVETYATVHQLVSTITGQLRPEHSLVDLLSATFPGGSMTGAPKHRTMEIIDRLEGEARGVYSGAIGLLGLNGSCSLNIVIRTIVCTPNDTTIGVGGAITALSDPSEEFEEILVKANGAVRAIVTYATGRECVRRPWIEGADVSSRGGDVASAVEPTFDLDAYLARISYAGPRAPTAEVLAAIHIAHAQTVPFENLDIALGVPIRLDLPSLVAKIVVGRRGGYCYEQNFLFATALRELGFAVEILAARVRTGSPRPAPRTHCLLRVTIDGAAWLADVGFAGEGLLEPLPWREGDDLCSGGIRYRLEPEGNETMLLGATPGAGWQPLYAIRTDDPLTQIDLELGNWFTSTHPLSPFTRSIVAQRISHDERLRLVNNDLTIRRGSEIEKTEIGDPDQLLEVLRTRFLLDFPSGTRFNAPAA